MQSLQILSWIYLLALISMCSGDKDVSGGFGDLEISPTRLTRVAYHGVHLPIWEHRQNADRQPGQKQYFTLPLVSIGSNSATCIHNVLTDSISLHLNIIMWSDELQAAMMSKLKSLTNVEDLSADQISIIPMERIRFVWKSNLVTLSDRFLLDDAWHSYALKTETVRPSINSDTMPSCEKLRDNINSQPEVLSNLELQFILQAKKSFQTKIRIKGEHLGKSLLIGQMRNLAGEDGWIMLQQSDLAAVSKEVVSNVIAKRETDSGYVDSGDRLSISRQLANALRINQVSSGEISTSDWSRVYWQPAAARPDLITTKMNRVFKKSDEGATGIVINIREYEQLMGGLPEATSILPRSKVANGSTVDENRLKEWLLENNIKSRWNGNEFAITPIKLYRIYISKLISRQSIVATDVQIHSNEHVYSLKPTISHTQPSRNASTSTSISAMTYKITNLHNQLKNINIDGLSLKSQINKRVDDLGRKVNEKIGTLRTGLDAVARDLSDPLRELRENDRIAQAICSTMSQHWVFAVRRDCFGTPSTGPYDCNTWCKNQPFINSDHQTKGRKRGCAGSIHIYEDSNNIQRNSTALINGHIGAYKVYNFGKICGGGCGPNYCCCTAS